MLNRITIGKYVYGNSLVHKWNPIIKLICSFCYIMALFSIRGWQVSILFGIILFFFLVQSGIRMKAYLQLIWQLRYMMFFLFLCNWLFGVDFLQNSLLLFKMNGALLYSAMVLYTTPIRDLTDAIVFLLHPLSYFRIPVYLFAHMIGLALSFLPNLLISSHQILKALCARGMDYAHSSFRQKLTIWNYILNSLMNQSLRYADAIAETMEVRLYMVNQKRKRKFTIGNLDWVFMFIHIFLIVLVRKEGVLCAI